MDAIVGSNRGSSAATVGVAPMAASPSDPLAVRKAAMTTAALGIAHSLLLLVAVVLLKTRVPGLYASDQEYVEFYGDPDERRVVIVAGLYLVPFAAIAFIWFFVALRMWVSAHARRENVLLSNVQLVSGIIYTTLLLAASSAMTVLANSVELTDGPIDPQLARDFPQFGTSLILVFSMRLGAMFVLTTSNIGRTAGILPRWFVLVGYAVAVMLLLTASLNAWLILVFPGWILIFCVILIDRARRIPRDLVLGA